MYPARNAVRAERRRLANGRCVAPEERSDVRMPCGDSTGAGDDVAAGPWDVASASCDVAPKDGDFAGPGNDLSGDKERTSGAVFVLGIDVHDGPLP